MNQLKIQEKMSLLTPFLIILLSVGFVAGIIISGQKDKQMPQPLIYYGQEYNSKNYTTEHIYQEVMRFMDWMQDTYGISCIYLEGKTPMRPNYGVNQWNHLEIIVPDFCSYALFYDIWSREFPYEEFSVPIVFRISSGSLADS